MSTPEPGCVVLTRSEAGNRAWADYLRAQGFRVYALPTIQTLPLPLNAVRAELAQAEAFDWLLFTSAAAVRYVRQGITALGGVWPLRHANIAVVGPRTAAAARAAGLAVSFQPSAASRRALAGQLPVGAGARVLLPQTTLTGNELASLLAVRGARVTRLPLYETHLITGEDQGLSRLLLDGKISCLVFASASAVRGTMGRLSPAALETAQQLPAIALGKEGAGVLRAAGFGQVRRTAAPTAAAVAALLQDILS